MDEQEIAAIESCQHGELSAFTYLYDSYIRKIYDFIYYKTHHKETAEDLTSQTFMKAMRGIAGFRPESGTFQAWLYRIARNTVIDWYRRQKPEENIEDIWGLGSSIDMDATVDAKQRLEKVRSALKHFNPQQREVIILRVWEQMSYKEIAEVTGRSENSCKMAFSRAVSKLRSDQALMAVLLLLFITHVRFDI